MNSNPNNEILTAMQENGGQALLTAQPGAVATETDNRRPKKKKPAQIVFAATVVNCRYYGKDNSSPALTLLVQESPINSPDLPYSPGKHVFVGMKGHAVASDDFGWKKLSEKKVRYLSWEKEDRAVMPDRLSATGEGWVGLVFAFKAFRRRRDGRYQYVGCMLANQYILDLPDVEEKRKLLEAKFKGQDSIAYQVQVAGQADYLFGTRQIIIQQAKQRKISADYLRSSSNWFTQTGENGDWALAAEIPIILDYRFDRHSDEHEDDAPPEVIENADAPEAPEAPAAE